MASSIIETDSASNDGSYAQDDDYDSFSDDGNSEHSGTKKRINKNIIRKAADDNFSYICEWNDCQHVSTSMNDFNHHVSKHRRGYTQCLGTDQDVGTGEYMFFCQWRECNANIEGQLDDFSRHVFYHTFHQYLKFLGLHIQKVDNLNSCLLETTSRNVIPELPEKLMCRWLDCGLTYDNPYIFYSHVSHHCEDYPKARNISIKCKWEGCEVVKKNWFKMKEHIRSHTQAKVVACPTCGSLFASNTRFIDHLKRQGHENEQKFECSHCSSRFGSERILRDHMRHHVNHYKCPLCDMTCHAPSAVRDHVRYRHSNERSFQCSHCDYKAKTQTDLRRHTETHVDKEKLYCNRGCDKSFSLRSHLFQHYLSDHKANQQYECHICMKRFVRGALLTSHLMENHKYKWPSGHKKFRYALNDDGIKRLQTIRYESIEVSQQVLGQSITTAGEASDSACRNVVAPVPLGTQSARALADSGEVREAEIGEGIQTRDLELQNRNTGDTEIPGDRILLTEQLKTSTDAKKQNKNGRGGKAKQIPESRHREDEVGTKKQKKNSSKGNPPKRQKRTTLSLDPVELNNLIVPPCDSRLSEKTNSAHGEAMEESRYPVFTGPASLSNTLNLYHSVTLPGMADPTATACDLMRVSDTHTGLAGDPRVVSVSHSEVGSDTHRMLPPVYTNLDRVVLPAQSFSFEFSPVKQEPQLGSAPVFTAGKNSNSQQGFSKFEIVSSSLEPYSYNVVAHVVSTEMDLKTPQTLFNTLWSSVKKEEISESQPEQHYASQPFCDPRPSSICASRPGFSSNPCTDLSSTSGEIHAPSSNECIVSVSSCPNQTDCSELTGSRVGIVAISSGQPMYVIDPQNHDCKQYPGFSYGHDYDPVEDRGSPVSELYNLQMLGEVALNVQESTREGKDGLKHMANGL